MQLANDGRPIPPFQRWSFTRPRYAQYLADMAAVHCAMEDALHQALGGGAGGGGNDAVGPSGPVRAALGRLGASSGLHRGEQLRLDLAALVAAGGGGNGGGSGGGSGGGGSTPPTVSGSSAAFAAYVTQLGGAARSQAGSAAERDRAALRLLACAYSLLVGFMSTGARVGAAAAERAGAAAAGALQCYTAYPSLDKRDPAAALVAAVDAAGADLSQEQRQVLYDELPRAFPKAALIVAALAHKD
ncbi:hypothetical protein MNEG_3713 [Monoraphidium neglectum]|uniref:Uncharacterized protein n=1 Tax=Monoraphidium neglectum TaxID=145388 RepID=A0A0D2NGU9_9CHLO|nr:hypothetical protein MNEG_3713 [Monoraphidium neglectum]KIZ04246.1 hypothetical protein MNEG_3713 [Monoraphidium neglectum]|eukprot:XP_013903265.1 hypothetical protein MNEG_3713 [Monoraphidium neglectum]